MVCLPEVFWCFQRVLKETSGIEWVNVFMCFKKKEVKIIFQDTYVWLFSFFSWRVEALVPSGSGLWSINVCTQLIRLDVSSAYRRIRG